MIDKNKSIYVAQSFTFSKKGIDKRGKPVYNPRHLIVIFQLARHELYALTEDFGEYYLDVLKKEEYKSYFASETDPNGSKAKIYAEKIIPILYEKVETY